MASGQLKPPEELENKYSLTAWYRRLGEGETEGKQMGYTAVQQHEDKKPQLGREGKLQPEPVRIRPSERAKNCSSQEEGREAAEFLSPSGTASTRPACAVFNNKKCGSVSMVWNTKHLQVKSHIFSCITTNTHKAGVVQGTARPHNQEGDIKEYYDQVWAISYGLSLVRWNIAVDRQSCWGQQEVCWCPCSICCWLHNQLSPAKR